MANCKGWEKTKLENEIKRLERLKRFYKVDEEEKAYINTLISKLKKEL